jgi:hypothetical protein
MKKRKKKKRREKKEAKGHQYSKRERAFERYITGKDN